MGHITEKIELLRQRGMMTDKQLAELLPTPATETP